MREEKRGSTAFFLFIKHARVCMPAPRITAPVVQWIELLRPKEEMWVRFLPGAHMKYSRDCGNISCVPMVEGGGWGTVVPRGGK